MKNGTIILALALLATSARAQVQINLDHLESKAVETVNISLSADMLRMAARFLSGRSGDAGKVQNVVTGLKGITVRSYKFAQPGQYSQDDLRPIRAQLAGPGWSRILSERSARETSEIYAHSEQGKVMGFTILSAEPRELTVISIDGAADLADLAGLGGAFGIPGNLVPNDSKEKTKGKQ